VCIPCVFLPGELYRCFRKIAVEPSLIPLFIGFE
jgi:hypothetical protein